MLEGSSQEPAEVGSGPKELHDAKRGHGFYVLCKKKKKKQLLTFPKFFFFSCIFFLEQGMIKSMVTIVQAS